MTMPEPEPQTDDDQDAVARPAIGTLDEYASASRAFFSDTVTAIVRSGDGVLSQIGVEQTEAIPPMQHTMASGQILPSGPLLASSEISFSRAGVVEGDFDEFHLAVYQTAEQLERDMTRHLFGHISELTEATSSVVRTNGGCMWEGILEMMETIHLSFDQDGTPTMPTIVVSPDTREKMGEAPSWFIERLNEIVLRRRDEWLVRRRTRRLPRQSH